MATLEKLEKCLGWVGESPFYINLLFPKDLSLKVNWLIYVFRMTLKICKSILSTVWGKRGVNLEKYEAGYVP